MSIGKQDLWEPRPGIMGKLVNCSMVCCMGKLQKQLLLCSILFSTRGNGESPPMLSFLATDIPLTGFCLKSLYMKGMRKHGQLYLLIGQANPPGSCVQPHL